MVLKVEDLHIPLPKDGDRPFAVQGVSFEVGAGELVCVVGESGSGKSLTARAVLGLLRDQGLHASRGRILFLSGATDLLALPERQMEKLRGAEISMIFQEPMTALNPLQRVEDQIGELFHIHGVKIPREQLRGRVRDLLAEMNIAQPDRVAASFPFELSGGQRQRVMIAMAFALKPRLVVADEPTTALDVTTQIQILEVLKRLQVEKGTSVLFITHDFGVVAEIADRVVVMRHGEVVEQGPVAELLRNPRTDYARTLLASVPRLPSSAAGQSAPERPTVLDVRGLSKSFPLRGGFLRKPPHVRALADVTFQLRERETVAVVGESGSGKTTLSRCLVRLIEPDGGSIEFFGEDLQRLSAAAFRRRRNAIQLVFQDPYSSLNPRMRVGQSIAAGPMAFGVPRAAALERARELLRLVGLEPTAAERYPHQFSGGQRQRIGLARALALGPKVLIADEPVSALDVTVQAQILSLLRDIKDRLGLAMLFITHDLRVAAEVADRIIVMQSGCIVDQGSRDEIFFSARHPYTRQLIASIPGRGAI